MARKLRQSIESYLARKIALTRESPLLYITAMGTVAVSDFWELPDPIEFMECGPANAFHAPGNPF
jgi:hypothetical protein